MSILRKLESIGFSQIRQNMGMEIDHKLFKRIVFWERANGSCVSRAEPDDLGYQFVHGCDCAEKTAPKQVSARLNYLCYELNVLKSNLEKMLSLILWVSGYE